MEVIVSACNEGVNTDGDGNAGDGNDGGKAVWVQLRHADATLCLGLSGSPIPSLSPLRRHHSYA